MQIAYIAGPYRASTKLGVIRNIIKARRVAKKYWRKGYAVFCPHLNSALMDGCAPDEVFLRGDLEFLQYADILVVMPGAVNEELKILRRRANKRGKQVQIAYIAGPYRAKTKLGIIRNVIKARRAAKKYWRKGYAVFCPHLNSGLMDGIAPEEVFLRGDLEFLKYADVLVVMPGWERSTGTLAEIEFAKAKGIPITYEG